MCFCHILCCGISPGHFVPFICMFTGLTGSLATAIRVVSTCILIITLDCLKMHKCLFPFDLYAVFRYCHTVLFLYNKLLGIKKYQISFDKQLF